MGAWVWFEGYRGYNHSRNAQQWAEAVRVGPGVDKICTVSHVDAVVAQFSAELSQHCCTGSSAAIQLQKPA
jgi:hypothetical protein